MSNVLKVYHGIAVWTSVVNRLHRDYGLMMVLFKGDDSPRLRGFLGIADIIQQGL